MGGGAIMHEALPEPVPGEGEDLSTASLAAMSPDFQRFLAMRLPVYQTFAKGSGFGVEFGSFTAFDHERRMVLLESSGALKNFKERPQIVDFDVYHELGHYKELFDDPKGYKRLIDDCKKHADGPAVFRLYNCLMDIYVNTNIANRAPVFRGGTAQFSDEVVRHYQKELFAERDWSDPEKMPLCFQFSDYLLQLGMGAEEGIKLAPQVAAIIAAGTDFLGEQISFRELIDLYLCPVIEHTPGEEWSGTISERRAVIDMAIRPIFERLLEQDKAAGRGELVKMMSSGQSVPGAPTLDNLRDAVKAALDAEHEKNLTADEKAARARGKQLGRIAAENDIPKEDLADFAARYERLQPIIMELANRWDELKAAAPMLVPVVEGYFQTGSLDLAEARRKFGDILRNPEEAAVFTRKKFEEQRLERPRELRVWVLPDLSGSMHGDIDHVKDLTIVLAGSMLTSNLASELAGEPIRCTLGVVGFSHEAIPLIEPTKDVDLAKIMAASKKIRADGGTDDCTALEQVLTTHTAEHREAIARGNVVELVLEITDGDTSFPDRTKSSLAELESHGAICRAINIVRDGEIPGGQFREIWGARGRVVSSAKGLPDTIGEILNEISTPES